ncbi:restriction endonuclease [Halomicrobium sp. IBSBa]|uniref:restriction endonuclease n=1 Tax=Halomicrobium sp. IBSBa TaxID=2778916 RepID=UPI001ABFEB0A|nr:restriction endonuclease [Halomicrobium sp. IBSBa]MBO4248389.1 restriction endonuclease [Halomicrobium sp. IBSBa]
MTGIVIFTAGREDAYQDYLRSVQEGYEPAELADFLPEDFTARASEDEPIRVWGTSVANKWRKVSQGDLVLVYRDGGFIAQARVLSKRDDLALAEHLYDLEGNPWDLDNPWQYLTFFTDFEEIDVDVAPFNELVGYESGYRPQGFTRVADDRIERVEAEHESVETAINELTDSGSRVHHVDDDPDDDDEEETADFGERLVAASKNGDAYDEFEQLVAEAFSRLGFEAQWIEGGDDTDVQLTSPVEAIVEVKARGNGQLQSPDASRIRGHQESRGAEYAVVVAPGFTPAAIDDANRDGLVLVSAARLRGLVERHEEFGLRPEFVASVLFEPGAFLDDRMDEIDEAITERRQAADELVSVMEALERGDGAYTAGELRHVLTGMLDGGVPDEDRIRSSLVLLAHPSLRVVEEGEDGYKLATSAEQGAEMLVRFGALLNESE